ncbi:serine O-acetyltransferase [Enterococcus sp. AZ109]
MLGHRLSHFLYQHQLFLLAKLQAVWCRFLTGIEIHPGAQIAHGVFIDHGMGLVIGETAVIEEDVVLFHSVTLGGTGKDTGKRHPTVRKGAMISAHAQILGAIVIGEQAKIGASSVVLEDVPAHTTVVGVPDAVVRVNQPVVQEIKTPVNLAIEGKAITPCGCH